MSNHMFVINRSGGKGYEFREEASVTLAVSKENTAPLAAFKVEIGDDSIPTVHLSINPGCNVGSIFVDGNWYHLELGAVNTGDKRYKG
jgi:hypothetical protein